MEKANAPQSADSSPDKFVIRVASAEDTGGILECLRTAFEPYRSQYTPQGYLDTVMTRDTILQRLAWMTVLVALDSLGHVVGTIGGAVVSSSEGHLRGMAVLPEWNGRGIATRLLEAMEKHLAGKGCVRISLDTTEPLQRAMRFYEKNRFRRTGKVGDFFGMPLIEYAKHL